MKTIALCDDNPLQLELLRDVLSDFAADSGWESNLNVEAFPSAEALLERVRTGPSFDVYILDIIMPGLNGMQLASELRAMNDEGIIIFLTASMDYAVSSYDVSAFNYILKPVEPARLFRILSKALGEPEFSGEALVSTHTGVVRIRFSDLDYIDTDARAPVYHCSDGSAIRGQVIRVPFREAVAAFMEEGRFIPCGASMLINRSKIERVDSESVLLDDGVIVFPPKTACVRLMNELASYSEKR